MAKFRAGSFKRSMKTLRPRFARVEPLEPRWLLAAPTLGYLPSSVNIAAGAPLPAFRDITLGGNAVEVAQPGYDLVTGLGTPDVNNLVQNLLVVQRLVE